MPRPDTIGLLLCLLGLITGLPVAAQDRLPFLRHTIDGENRNSACCLIDVNRDGQMDIVCGNHWYQSPGWQRHAVRTVDVIRGRQDDYSNLVLDVNNDEFPDIISANYRSQSLYWLENPAAPDQPDREWRRHEIARPGAMETGRLADINGDGTPDILPNGTTFAAWWSLRAGAVPNWERHPLPSELAGHGLGHGDINGDGRVDVVGPGGWAEAPVDRERDRWAFHPEFSLGKDASIPILVEDVDGDGDRDLVWGRGHQTGLCWLEQTPPTLATDRTWTFHVLDSSTSQNHSLLWRDVDGNGRSELIAGSRFRAHDGRDVGEANPLTILSCEYNPESRTWQRRLISLSDRVGWGVDPKAADVDADGDDDLVCADLSGLYLLENRRIVRDESVSVATGPQPEDAIDESVIDAGTYQHTDLSTVVENGVSRPLATPADAGLRRQHILQGLSLAMGPVPDSTQRCPLEVKIHSSETAEGLVRQRISWAPEPGDRVPAWLLIPEGLTEPAAAMLCLHQTTGIGKDEPAGLGGLPNLHYALELAQRGYVCLVPDYPSFGEYPWDFRTQGKHYASGSMKAIWNNMRAVDLLQGLPQVNPERIGCIGHSLGGHNTLFTAAFDQRLKAVITSCGFTGFHDYYGGNLAGWTSDRYMPRIREQYGNDPNRVPFDFQEVLAAIAPRAVFVSAPLNDDNFDNAGVRRVVTEAAKVYQIFGVSESRLTTAYPDCGHDFPESTRNDAWQWLQQHL